MRETRKTLATSDIEPAQAATTGKEASGRRSNSGPTATGWKTSPREANRGEPTKRQSRNACFPASLRSRFAWATA